MEELVETVILEILAADVLLATVPGFHAVSDETLPAPRLVAAAKDEGPDDLTIEGRSVRNFSCRVIFTAAPATTAEEVTAFTRAIQDKLDAPSATAGLAAFDIFTIIERGEGELNFDTHRPVITVPLTLKVLLTAP